MVPEQEYAYAYGHGTCPHGHHAETETETLKSTHGASQQEYPTDSARLVSVSICSRDQHIPKAYMWPSGRQLAAASFSDCTGGNLDGGQRLGARLARCGTNSLLRQPALRVGIPETNMPARTMPLEPSVRLRTLNLRCHHSSQLPLPPRKTALAVRPGFRVQLSAMSALTARM